MAAFDVSASIGALIVDAAVAAGASPADLQARTGFDLALAGDPDARIPLAMETALWDEAAAATGDDAFGVHAAGRLRPGLLDVLDYVVRVAPTLLASLERLARYNRLLHDAAVFRLVEVGRDVVRVEHTLPYAGATQSHHAAEFTLASLVVVGAQIVGQPVRPMAVELRHEKPEGERPELERVFGVAPRFSRPVNALELPRALLERPTPNDDPALSRVVLRHAEALLAARPAPVERTADRVRRLLTTALAEGERESALGAIAAKLHMSERSLQRRLAEDAVRFDALVDEVRREMAARYLADRKVAIAEIAYLLGYSEPSAFHRAFKRWTGSTPAEARQRL
jgi:AraC-like DNA-binding protein